MKKLFLSFIALTMVMFAWGAPNGNYHLTKAVLHNVSAEPWSFAEGGVDIYTAEDGWDVEITTNENGSCSLYNLLAWGETLTGSYDTATGELVIHTQMIEEEYYICGGIRNHTQAQALMDYIDQCHSYVTKDVVDLILNYNQKTNTITLGTPILLFFSGFLEEGENNYIGQAFCVYSEDVLQGEREASEAHVTLTVNQAEGVTVSADVEVDGEADTLTVVFEDGVAEVEGAQFIRIYNVEPYLISSVEVNGQVVEAEEAGTYYFIEVTDAVETINITVEEQETVEMTMSVTVYGLDKFEKLAIMDYAGENGKAVVMESQLAEGEAVPVYFTNFDLPLQVFGSWADGTEYKMEVTLNGEALTPAMEGPTSAQFVDIEPATGAEMVISLTGSVIPAQTVTLTVNDAAGVNVSVDVEVDGEADTLTVVFEDGVAEVEGAQFIKIYNVEPYLITSVTVNGEEIAGIIGGESYFVEVTAATETIAITVEEQEVVDMTMNVTVYGLDKFQNLAILDKNGENGKAVVMESQLAEGEAIPVYFTNFDLPLQVFGSWADGTDCKMEVTLDGEAVAPVNEGSTSALFMGIEPAEGANLVISLTGEAVPAETVTMTVNEAAGVYVLVETAEDVIDVVFEDSKAEVEAPQFIRIYNVDPYIITSVTVNGEEIAAIEGGRYYFIEANAATKTINITVEEQEVVDMAMMVYVSGLDKFEDLVILDKDGERGKGLTSKMNFDQEAVEGQALVEVNFTNLDLPLMVYGTWEDGNDYHMVVMVDGDVIEPVQEGPTSALFMDIYVENEQFLSIELKGETTAIQKVEAQAINGKWYNLQGMEVNKANLMTGNIYINSGKKYLVK